MKYTITTFIIACILSGYAIYLGGWWHLFHWFAFTFFAISIGHHGLRQKIFGKRVDGTIPLWAKIIHFPFLLYTKIIWGITQLISRENAIDQVSPDLIIGRWLRKNERLKELDHYMDLTAEFEAPKAIRESPEYTCLPILDGWIPKAQDLKDAISRVMTGRTYVHCAQGHGRTGLFTIALLFARGQIQSVEDGLELLKKVRPGVRLNSAQRRFIHEYVEAQTTSNKRLEELAARLGAAQDKAWWRDMTGLVGEKDQQLAVIGPRPDTTADDLRSLGKSIEQWKSAFPRARHIWGLTDLLEGRFPRTPPIYLTVPYPVEHFEERYEPVALVYVAEGTDMEAAMQNLSEWLSDFQGKLAWLEHPDIYSYRQR